jgi:alpha-1,4-digalacturonate transport system substrate-binding protein
VNARTKLIALGAVTVLALTGCAAGAGSDDTPTLQFVLSGDGTQGGGYQAMADKYQEETGVTVEIVDVPYDDLVTKLRNGAQAGDLPALARASDLDPIWSNSLLDLSDIAAEQDVMESLLVANDNDEILALPSDLTAVGLYINKSLFDEAGVSYPASGDTPWTWDEYIAAIQAVQAATGARYGMVMDGSAHRLRSMMYEFGSTGVEEQSDGTFEMNDDSKTAIEYFKEISDDTIMPKSVWLSGEDPSALFKSGQVAAYYSGVWQITDFAENITDFEWQSVLLPAQTVRSTNLGTNWMVAFDGTGVEDETRDFINWLYEPDNYAELSEISGFLPAVEGLDITYQNSPESFALYNEEIAATDPIAAEQAAEALRKGYLGQKLEFEPLKDEVVKYLNDEQDIDTTIVNINEQTSEAYGE